LSKVPDGNVGQARFRTQEMNAINEELIWMSLRWRKTGELLCGAKSEAMDDDCYIDDEFHYRLSCAGLIEPHDDEHTTGLWKWLNLGPPYWE